MAKPKEPIDPVENLKALVDVMQSVLETEKEVIKMIQMIGQQLYRTDAKVDALIKEKFSGGGAGPSGKSSIFTK